MSANQQRLMQVLLAPTVSEKSTFVGDKNNQVVFRVADDATKPEIKAAVERAFEVTVEDVNTAMAHGRRKRNRYGRAGGEPPVYKKAVVTVAPGQTIEFFEGV